MTTNIPPEFKSADISRFAQRASQLEKFKPIIAYWCEYYIVQQILNKGLHTESDECMKYTTDLMDKLENVKASYPNEDAILDDITAKAYVEQFAMETFQRAENAVRANKASAQTADTYRAAATFFDLLGIFGSLEQDAAAKSKYAKYHALRIAKALKAGEDPNLSNPVQEPTPATQEPQLDPNDPEVRRINGDLQPTVESVPESPRSIPNQPSPAAISPALAQPNQNATSAPEPTSIDVSPLDPSPGARKDSASATSPGGGYFPVVPTFASENAAPNLPTAPLDAPTPDVNNAPSADPRYYYHQPPLAPTSHSASVPVQAPAPVQPMPVSPPPQVTMQYPPPSTRYITTDEAITDAQKHAKWAISALNFEDVNTAVKELRIALQALGAR